MQVTATNTSNGPKILNSLPPVVLKPGETVEDVEISEAEFASMESTGYFEFGGGERPLTAMKVADLKALAEKEGIDLGDATKKDDIIAAIELAREAAQG